MENGSCDTAQLSYVTMGYLRRCCNLRNHASPSDMFSDTTKGHVLENQVYHLEEVHILMSRDYGNN